MTPLPRITVITPSFNQAHYLEATIRSVLDQRYPNLEYFVVDGDSRDDSVAIIRQYADGIDWWVSEEDNGQTHALNKGLARATGDIVAYINSDDLLMPDSLHRVASAFSAQPDLRWLIGACEQIDAEGNAIGRFNHHAPDSFASYLGRQTGMIPQPSCFWAMDLFRRHGTFRLDMHYCFDFEFHCRLLAEGEKPHFIPESLAAFRMHDASKGGSQVIRFGLERIRVMQQYLDRLSPAEQKLLRRRMGYMRRAYAIQQAALPDGPSLWSQLVRHPWWLGSQQVREALFSRNGLTQAA